VVEAVAMLAQSVAARDEDLRNLDRQRALEKDGITTTAALTGAEAAAAVSAARVKSADAAIASAKARVRVTDEALENTNVRAPFDGVVIKKRAEVGETVSPFGVAGQATREGGAIATIADLGELEVQTEVSENSVAKLTPDMPAEVKLRAYEDQPFRGKLRQVFPSADRAKSIVEVRVSILNPDVHVKPEMTATVTFQERHERDRTASGGGRGSSSAASDGNQPPIVLVPKRAVAESGGHSHVWVVTAGTASRRPVTLGAERIDQVEVRSGIVPGEAVIVNPPPALADRGLVRVKGT
jgi:RND family efflux transporter MFP subunit